MALKFRCTGCQDELVIRFLNEGEVAVCKSCGENNIVPRNAESVSDEVALNYQPPKKEPAIGSEIREMPVIGPKDFGSVGAYMAILYVGLVSFIIGILSALGGGGDAASVMLVLGVVLFLVAEIFFLVLLYKVWDFIISESRSHGLIPSIESPGKAIGFMFIPFYNLYWVFQAFGKLPKDFNQLARARGCTRVMSDGLGTGISILLILGIIPFVGYIAALINEFILKPIFIRQSIDLCRYLCDSSFDGAGYPGSSQSPQVDGIDGE